MALRTMTAARAARHTTHTAGPQLTTTASRSMGGAKSTTWTPSDASATADQCTCARVQPAKEPPRNSATPTPTRLKVNSHVMSQVQRPGLACLVAASRRRTASRDQAAHLVLVLVLVPALAPPARDNPRPGAQQRHAQ